MSKDDETVIEVDYNIKSLTDGSDRESKEEILKRELSDFAKMSPETIAAIIKSMFRKESGQ